MYLLGNKVEFVSSTRIAEVCNKKKNTRKIPVKVEVEGKPTNQKEVKFPTLMRFAFVYLIHREIDVWFYLLQIKTVS